MIKRTLSALLALGLSTSALATDRMYGVIGGGYSDLEFSQQSTEKEQFQFALGHQFLSRWYVELGFQQLADDLNADGGLKADALYLAVLGKAGGPLGELYYKLGVMNADIQGIQPSLADDSCELGSPASTSLSGQCSFDEGVLAGMVGVGFDFHVGLRTMVRLEATHVRGQEDFQANLISLGVRYNFN